MRVDLHRDIASLPSVCGTCTYGTESGPKDQSLQQCCHGTQLRNERNIQLGNMPQWNISMDICFVTVLFLSSGANTATITTSNLTHRKWEVCNLNYLSDNFDFYSRINPTLVPCRNTVIRSWTIPTAHCLTHPSITHVGKERQYI
jgi:hypothetical protein